MRSEAMRRAAGLAGTIGVLAGAWAARAFAAAELIDATTPWRTHLAVGGTVRRDAEGLVLSSRRSTFRFELEPVSRSLRLTEARRGTAHQTVNLDDRNDHFSPLAPADWLKADFDDACWARYTADDLADYLGGYGAKTPRFSAAGQLPALLCLRTGFGIADPARATDLKVTVTYIGGAVVYVNGQEVGRGYLPQGDLHPLMPAEDYPIQAYTTEDGTTALPALDATATPEPKWLARYEKRVRTFTLAVPQRVLIKGRNVLAVELHPSAITGPSDREGWCHVGFRGATLTSASGAGVIPYAEAVKGTHVWSANTLDQVAEAPSAKPLIARSFFWTLIWARGMPVRGIRMGNPFAPVLPAKIVVPRNGAGSGQVVLSDLAGLAGVSATVHDLKGRSGATIPASAVQVRFAAQPEDLHFCDALLAQPPKGAKTVPVWLIVQAPKDAASGWYASTLGLAANGKTFNMPVRVLVSGFAVPDARDFTSTIGVTQSPDTLALHYQVEPWSDAHFRLMERSFELMAQLGNDHVHVPVLKPAHFNWNLGMVRFVKTESALKPDFSILEKYLDAYAKHCAPPRALTLYIWHIGTATEIADAYERGRRIPSREYTAKGDPMATVWDPAAKTVSEVRVPRIGEEGAEAFYRPLLEGVRRVVQKRGWPERIIMLGLGGDKRPSQRDGELMRQWAPYARWNLLSHFSGDPDHKDGRLIATGGLEIGVKEWPYFGRAFFVAPQAAQRLDQSLEFLELPTSRWYWQDYSPPLVFRTTVLQWGCVGRVGLDFWLSGKGREQPSNTSFFSHIDALTAPGPDGAVPTVRFQMMREGVQEWEARAALLKALAKLPEEQQKAYADLLDELGRRMSWGSAYLSQHELSYDWPAYVAAIYQAATDVTGVKSEAKWEEPPR